jgi:2-iminobutanoate/2-iminopropanoate deaminase
MIERLSPPGVPKPQGPYSPAVRAGDYIFVSGQIAVDPVTGQRMTGDIEVETRRVLDNIQLILEGSGASMADVVKCSVFLGKGSDFAAMNAIYAEYFGDQKPARSTIVCGFVADILVEIDCIAYKPE